MLKNPTPRQIAISSALMVAGFVLLTVLIFELLPNDNDFIWEAVFILLTALASTYFVTLFYLRRYIYRKIKLIYKTIHQEKLYPNEKKKSKNFDMNTHIMDEMEKEVEQWADRKNQELNKFKNWAEYRRKFVGDISHELKTPIFNVQGYIHSLLDGALEDESVNKVFLKKAAKNITRLQTIVEDLEAIARFESGEMLLELQVFDLKDLVRDVFEELDFKAQEKNIALIFKDGASQSYKVKADRENIRQVLINLVHNSIKYGQADGRTKVGFYDMDKNILVEVADNGIGIPRKHINHVFDRFYRVDKSRSRIQGGSGLGLSIVKHIVEAHNQTINVRSTPNLGSTFGFTIEKA
ncbi:MAG: ATP-binding protein [Bacteroidota bacterium]